MRTLPLSESTGLSTENEDGVTAPILQGSYENEMRCICQVPSIVADCLQLLFYDILKLKLIAMNQGIMA